MGSRSLPQIACHRLSRKTDIMQIVIPMSGFGERFRRAGYAVPKPLIPVDGKPIIAHVVDLFPGETKFIFICNRDHLANPDYHMAEILRDIAPTGKIVPIAPHSLGPVNAVLQAAEHIDPSEPTIVNYCDFTCYWHYDDFKRFVVESDADGCIPAYRGFHPHSLGSTFYAYTRHENLWMTEIQEKKPFTDSPLEEYASSGTYYFKNGALCLEVLRAQVAEDRSVNGEFYVSLAYQVMANRHLKIAIYELQHFMQWGTPQDLREYQGWSNVFRRLASSDGRRARHDGAILLPMAGLGKRFSDAGYALPKPLVPVSGRPMVIQAVGDLPDTAVQKFVLRKDLGTEDAVARKLRSTFTGARILELDGVTEGQAITTVLGLEGLDLAKPVTIGACDNGILYDVDVLTHAVADATADLLVWIVRGHADGIRRPEMFGWVMEDEGGAVTGTRVKQTPDDPATAAMITGTFTFRRAEHLKQAVDALVARNGRVNGEFYLDSVIDDCLTAGLRVMLFEVDAYVGWGTPIDLQTFEYWQSCFDKWPSHPYRLERDQRVPAIMVRELRSKYAWTPAPRPGGVAQPATEDAGADRPDRMDGTLGEVGRFVPIGAISVLIDFVAYYALVLAGLPTAWAKTLSFVAGALFSYHGNRRVTFRASVHGISTMTAFFAVYLASLAVNVGVNAVTLTALGSRTTPALGTAWFLATACSATLNFIGMKFFVFKRR